MLFAAGEGLAHRSLQQQIPDTSIWPVQEIFRLKQKRPLRNAIPHAGDPGRRYQKF
jgi:hypothetical protein